MISLSIGIQDLSAPIKHFLADKGIGSDFSVKINAYSQDSTIKENGTIEFTVYITNKYFKTIPASLNISVFNMTQENIILNCLESSEKPNIYCQNNTFFYENQVYDSDSPSYYKIKIIPKEYYVGKYSICFEVKHFEQEENKDSDCFYFSIV